MSPSWEGRAGPEGQLPRVNTDGRALGQKSWSLGGDAGPCIPRATCPNIWEIVIIKLRDTGSQLCVTWT